jgi:CRISPR/Cas system-associated exonuclease Cas4 (RecB family)
MKTYDDDSNIQAYNFFRVIQRADNVYIFYNLLVSDDARGKSRFILQLENEISKSTIIQKTYSICIPKLTDDDISIEKNENMLEKIKSVSPTDISTYLTCSLKFYFQKILGIWEEDKVEEEYNAGTMGSLLHKVMELIYKPYENKTVNEETIEKIINSINNDFDKIFSNAVEGIINEQKEHKRPEKSIDTGKYGKNKAYKEMIREQALKILEWDKTKKLFDIKGLEKNMQKNDYEFTDKKNVDRKIILKGKLDRIEQKDNSIFIVDYKTGSLKFPSNGKIESLEIAMSNNKFKDYFQAGFYIYLYERINKEKADAGMFYVANQSALQKVSDVKIKDNSPSKNEVADKQNTKEGKEQKDFFSEFGNFLDKKLADIFDTSIRFSKTSEPKDCAYCPMTSLCYRESTNSW